MARVNSCWVFKARPGPEGLTASLFELKECPMPAVGPGQALVATYLLSLDPTIRNALAGPQVSDHPQAGRSMYYQVMNWEPGTVPTWTSVGYVVESQNPGLPVGACVKVTAPWQRYVSVSEAEVLEIDDTVRPENYLSVLGLTGLTAMLPITKYAQAKSGETAYVSGGAGATGLVVCQLLVAAGCHVVASAGSDDKLALLKTMGVEAFNYKTEGYLKALQARCPKGIDLYWDNVGAEALEATLELMNDFGRVIACGSISQYDTPPDKRYGIKNLFHIVGKRLMVQGFICFPGPQFTPEDFGAATARLRELLKSGALRDEFTLRDGFEALIPALCALFRGENVGKMLVRVPEAKPAAK